jgi:hypothetical protein
MVQSVVGRGHPFIVGDLLDGAESSRYDLKSHGGTERNKTNLHPGAMNSLPDNGSLQIPENLRAQFQRLERRLWWVDTVIALCGALSGLIVSYTLLFISDRFWDTPFWLRALFTLTGLALAVYFAWGWFRHWILRRRDFRVLSGIVQRHYRRLGDRLLGIVELADPAKRPDNVSPELCRAAIRQVSAEAIQFDFRQAVATRKPRIYALVAVFLLVLVVTPWLLVPEASRNALARWLWPGAAYPRYTFVSLDQLPDRLVVAHGEPFEIACYVKLHPFWKPSWARCQFEQQPVIRTPVFAGRMVFSIPGQTKPGRLTLKIGDVTRRILIEPMLRPALKALHARIQFPAYLQYPEGDELIPHGSFSYLDGSRIAFRAWTSRNLSSASLRLGSKDKPPAAETPARVEKDSFATDKLDLKGLNRALFAWTDEYGLTSAAPWLLTFQAKPDQAPETVCPEQAAVVAMLEDEIIEVKAEARDDYGLRQLAMAWECQKRQETNLVAGQVSPILDGAPQSRNLHGSFQLAPALMHLPPDTLVTMRAVSWDYYPDRARAESDPYRVYILSHEEHARLIQQELERIMAELEELTRKQEALLEAGKEVRRLTPEELAAAEAAKKLAEQASEEANLGEKLSALSQKTANTLKEAMRNKTIPTERIEEWARHAQTMREISQQQMALAMRSLSTAQQNPGSRGDDLQEALELEEEALRRLMELQKQIGPALDRMMANTLANRLRRVAKTEGQIGGSLKSIVAETIGLEADAVPEKFRETLHNLTGDQDRARAETQQLQNEISRFFERTTERIYGAVAHEMKETQAIEELGKLTDLIRENVAVVAMTQTAAWKDHFNEWADKLEKAKQEGGGGGGGGSMSEAALKRLLALLRLRQTEINIREHSRVLESRKATQQSYREDGIILSIRQLYVKQDTDKLDQASPGKFLPHAVQAMGEAEKYLTEPRTDEPVQATETDAVNLLESEIMDMLKSSSGSGLAATMGMMMQMMGMGATPGGSFAGGTTDKANPGLEGNFNGASGEERSTEKLVGRSARVVPVEYREALQKYHRAVQSMAGPEKGAKP